jgi:nitrogen fixation protein FixH
MHRFNKLLGIVVVLSIVALPLTGCDNPPWEAGMALNLKVDSPKNGATVNTATVTVSGRVGGKESSGAKVTVNNADVAVNDGKYTTSVTLTEGKNVISIVAKNGQATPSEQVTVTYVPQKQ